MGERKAVIIVLLFSLLLLGSMSGIVFGQEDNWVEVTRFTQESNTNATKHFAIESFEWRIRVEVIPSALAYNFFGHLLNFSVSIYPKGETNYSQIITMGNGDWEYLSNGTWIWSNKYEVYNQENTEEFDLNIKTELVDRYLVIIEQNTNSIPISEGNWVEIKRFTGSGGIGAIPTFNVDHVDWRILWQIEPGNGSERVAFLVYIYPATGGHWFEQIEHYGTEETTGILNIYNYSGSFYMNVLTGTVDSYTVIIEENIASIPEFPSWTILPVFLIATLTVIIFKKRLFHQRS